MGQVASRLSTRITVPPRLLHVCPLAQRLHSLPGTIPHLDLVFESNGRFDVYHPLSNPSNKAVDQPERDAEKSIDVGLITKLANVGFAFVEPPVQEITLFQPVRLNGMIGHCRRLVS